MTGTHGRRVGRGTAVLVIAALGLALFALTLLTWARAEAETLLGAEPISISGTDAVAGVPSAALLVLVSGVVLGLAGRVTRVLALVGAVLGGLLCAASALAFLLDPEPALRPVAGALSGAQELAGGVELTVWPYLVPVVGVLAALTGVLLPLRLGHWERVGRRYEIGQRAEQPSKPVPESVRARTQAMSDWDALSRGEDPTDGGEPRPPSSQG